MTGTTYTNGVSTRKSYAGSTSETDNSNLAADTKFINRTAVIRCTAQAVETQTGFTLPTSAIVKDVYLNVIAIDATETVNVGTQGVSNVSIGYLDGVSVAAVGLVKGELSDGSGLTRGSLLREETGVSTDVAYAPTVDITAGGDPISFTCSPGSDTAVFDIIIEYVEVVSEIN